jgi:diguanylate cyclase (GGDEF)-like protein
MNDRQDTGEASPQLTQAEFARRRRAILTLSRKVLLAFSCLVVMGGACGVVGVIFFERIAASVSVLSAVSTPLLIESMTLQRNADQMRSVLFENGGYTKTADEQLQTLDRLGMEGRRHTERLRALAASAGLLSKFEIVEQLRYEFAATLKDIVQARARLTEAETNLFGLYTDIHAVISVAEDRAIEIARLSAGESEAAANRLIAQQIAAAHRVAATALAIESDFDLSRLENAVEVFNSAMSGWLQRLRVSVRTLQDEQAFEEAEAAVRAVKTGMTGPSGLLLIKKEALAATAIFGARSKKLNEIDTRYAQVLSSVTVAVRNQNEASRAQTASTIGQGRTAVVAVVGIMALVASAAAVFLTISISRPIQRLTIHAQNVRERGELIPIADRALLASGDELGDLSRMFNGMILELAEAREQLIAKSEAEISKQVERLRAAVGNMSQGLCMFDQDQRLIISNDRYAEIYGLSPKSIRAGMTLEAVLKLRLGSGGYHGDPSTYVARRIAADREKKADHNIFELQNGRIVQMVKRPLKDGGWVATHEDITERRLIEAKIAHMAHHDVLTNLPNRVLFRERMNEGLVRVSRGETLAVLCLDLDHFKAVNDTLGHSIGDMLLQAVTTRLINCVREIDTVARLGGDEFAIIQVALHDPHQAITLAQRIIDAIAAPFTLEGHQVCIGTSVGIALAPNDGRGVDELLAKADLALYRAKADGRGNCRFFEPGMDAEMHERRALEVDLRNALAGGEFELFYQPLVDLKSERITGFEALLRWRQPQRGLVAPADFIPLAEEIGLIIPIGEWVLHRACREAAGWPANVQVSVNLSPAQFKSRNLVQAIAHALSSSGLAPERLELEITESVLLYENDAALKTLLQIKALGVKVAMDDFGTGYSSLSYLRSFPFDKIKIDRSFIRDLTNNEDCAAIVRAVTSLGESLGMSTVAEGVETVEQMERLRLEGCIGVQGFLISPPKSAAEIAPMLADLRADAAA